MSFLIDMMIAAAALLAAAYCMLLSRRLRALTRLDGDVGRAIAVLSHQVDELTKALRAAEQSNSRANLALEQQIERAESTARRLELLMAAQQPGAAPMPVVSAVAPRGQTESKESAADFAPFARAAIRTGPDPRTRVLRQRDLAGTGR